MDGGETFPIAAAQWCLSRIVTEEEREDRLGDLEEVLRSTARDRGVALARRRYLREAGAVCVSALRRRIEKGGEDMVRLFLWAAVSVFLIFAIFQYAGGEPSIYVQPFEWAIMLAVMLGFALAGQRLGVWRVILGDLRRADQLTRRARRDRRSDYVGQLKRGSEEGSPDFAHVGRIARIARQVGTAEADRLMEGGIALFKESCREKLKIVEQTAIDAYVSAAIAALLGIIHTLAHADLEQLVVAHLLGGAFCAPFYGLIVGRGVLAPLAGRLSALYAQEAREMEAFRLSAGEEGTSAFEALA